LGLNAGKPLVTLALPVFDAGKSLVTLPLPFFHATKSLITLALPFVRFALEREPLLIIARNLLNEGGLIANQQGHCFLKMNIRVTTVPRRHVPKSSIAGKPKLLWAPDLLTPNVLRPFDNLPAAP
jgi:hypothetical protein